MADSPSWPTWPFAGLQRHPHPAQPCRCMGTIQRRPFHHRQPGWDTSAHSTNGFATCPQHPASCATTGPHPGLASDLQIGVILTVSDFYQGAGGALWQATLQDALVGFWRSPPPSAGLLPRTPEIIGYDLLSKPYPDPTLSFAELNALPAQPAHPAQLGALVLPDRHSPTASAPHPDQGVCGGAARGWTSSQPRPG